MQTIAENLAPCRIASCNYGNSQETVLPMFMPAVGQCPFFLALLDSEKMHSLISKSCACFLPLALCAPQFSMLHSIYLAALLCFTSQLSSWTTRQFVGC